MAFQPKAREPAVLPRASHARPDLNILLDNVWSLVVC